MGQFKKEYFDNFYKTTIIEKKIFAYHVEDDFINLFIKKKGKIDNCDYCNRRKKVIPFEDFFSLLDVGLNYLFEDVNDSRYIDHDGEHGLDGNTFLAYDIVFDDKLNLRIEDDTLCKDIYESIDKDVTYCERGEFGDLKDYYNGEWNYFKEILKHKARFVFYFKETFKDYFHTNPIMILNNIQGEIINQNLFKELTTSDKIYRCTQHFLKDDVKKDGKRIASNPIENCKTNNRMSPAGISMFYGSIDKKTSIKEVVNSKDN